MSSPGIVSARAAAITTVMRNLAWWAAAVVLLLGGCAGGQTGHNNGDSEHRCNLNERDRMSYEEAAEIGVDVRPLLSELVIGPEGLERDLVLVAPPKLWTERGMTAPPDRAVEASLRIWANGEIWFLAEDGDFEVCGNFGFVGVDLELIIPGLELTLTGTGRSAELFSQDGPLKAFNSEIAELEVDELGSCFWNYDEVLECGRAVYGSPACIDEAVWRTAPVVVRAELSSVELLERVLRQLPAELECARGEPPFSLELQLSAPERFCTPDALRVPITTTLMPGDPDAAQPSAVTLEVDAECAVGPWDCSGSVCESINGDPRDPVKWCDRVSTRVTVSGTSSLEVTAEVDSLGVVTATAVVFDAVPDDDSLSCAAFTTFQL
jgi:hypothetical protein